jgi:hypothetical protein
MIHVVYVVIYLRMLYIFSLNVHFINTIELLCLTILITLFPSQKKKGGGGKTNKLC